GARGPEPRREVRRAPVGPPLLARVSTRATTTRRPRVYECQPCPTQTGRRRGESASARRPCAPELRGRLLRLERAVSPRHEPVVPHPDRRSRLTLIIIPPWPTALRSQGSMQPGQGS